MEKFVIILVKLYNIHCLGCHLFISINLFNNFVRRLLVEIIFFHGGSASRIPANVLGREMPETQDNV